MSSKTNRSIRGHGAGFGAGAGSELSSDAPSYVPGASSNVPSKHLSSTASSYVPQKKQISVATYNILSTDLIPDICETKYEYTHRYTKSIETIKDLSSRNNLDFVMLQECDEPFESLYSKLRDKTYFKVTKNMGRPYHKKEKQIHIIYKNKWVLSEDYTSAIQQIYDPIHPFRGQLCLFRSKETNKHVLVANIHLPGFFKETSIKILKCLFQFIHTNINYFYGIPIIIAGDAYVGSKFVDPIMSSIHFKPNASIEYLNLIKTLIFGYLTPPVTTSVHDFNINDRFIVYNSSKSSPELFCYSSSLLRHLGTLIFPGELKNTPYSYDMDCIANRNKKNALQLSDLDYCRNEQHGGGTGLCRNHEREFKHGYRPILNWPSDHCFIINKFEFLFS